MGSKAQIEQIIQDPKDTGVPAFGMSQEDRYGPNFTIRVISRPSSTSSSEQKE